MTNSLRFASSISLIVVLFFNCANCGLWSVPAAPAIDDGILPNHDPHDYGVDHSFPIHHNMNSKTIFGQRYHDMMKGCYAMYSKRECDSTEQARIEMNFDQPRMQHNYTKIGFKKMRAPKSVWDPLIAFYEKYKDQEQLENWPRGNTYVNSWESPSYMISLENRNFLRGAEIKQQIWDGMRPVIEEWTGKKVIETSLYGIRSYKNGSILSTHVDRLPLVSSCIINVAQDLDEPWPIEVYSHDGKAHNVTMEPGDIVLYESHTVLHGRPFPMKGKFFANIFVHFSPIDHDEMNAQDAVLARERAVRPPTSQGVVEAISKMESALKRMRKDSHYSGGGHEQFQHTPETIRRHMEGLSEEEPVEVEDNALVTDKHKYVSQSSPDGRTALHVAAAHGDLVAVEQLLRKEDTDLLHMRDENNWQALHEAARGGHTDIVQFLVESGADISARTSNGGTALWWAKQSLAGTHPAIRYLESIGAPEGEEF